MTIPRLPMSALLAAIVIATGVASGLGACSRDAAPSAADVPPPFVRTVAPRAAGGDSLTLSGIVRARYQTPLAFQVGGRIASRQVDSGQAVRAGDLLFRIDLRDLAATRQAAVADEAAAAQALATAIADRERSEQLLAQGFVSRQAVDRAELLEREARTRAEAARSRAELAGNSLGYGELRAPADGILAEVTGEAGQVVAPGQTVAILARAGDREVEVFLPDQPSTAHQTATAPKTETHGAHMAAPLTKLAPESGEALLADGSVVKLTLRELAAAADPASGTWKARYHVGGGGRELHLGSVLRTRFALGDSGQSQSSPVFEVPLAALDERGDGVRVWVVVAGKVEARPVKLIGLTADAAQIRGDLPAGAAIVALGTHLLQSGMAVRELPR